MILAHQFAFRPDVFGQILTKPSRSGPGRFCTIWSVPSLEKQNWNRCGKSDPAYTIQPDSDCMLAIKAITGHNKKCFWIGSGMFTGYAVSEYPVWMLTGLQAVNIQYECWQDCSQCISRVNVDRTAVSVYPVWMLTGLQALNIQYECWQDCRQWLSSVNVDRTAVSEYPV